MAETSQRRFRIGTPVLVALAAGTATVCTTAWVIAPAARPLVVLVVLAVMAAVARRLVLAGGARPDGSAPVRRDVAGDELVHLVERGMGDLNRYLEHHAAFAAYLTQRPARPGRGARRSESPRER